MTERKPFLSLKEALGDFLGTDLEMRNRNVGVGLLIVDIHTGKILVGEEPKEKTENGITFYNKGAVTTPSETRKKNERVIDNVRAAILEEIYGNNYSAENPNLGQYVYMPHTIDDRKHFMQSNIPSPNTPKRADLIIIGYTGHPTEVIRRENYLQNMRWTSVSEIMENGENYRRSTKNFLEEIFFEGNGEDMMNCILTDFKDNFGDCIRIFPENFDPVAFNQAREKMEDCSLTEQ